MEQHELQLSPADEEFQPHVLIFPYPLQGHINPLFSLARFLTSSGILVTFVHSQTNYDLLLPPQQRPADALLRVESIPEATPPTDTTDRFFQHSMRKFEVGLQHLMQKLCVQKPPLSCLVSDLLMPWTHHLATKFGIQKFDFCPCSAFTYQLAYHLQDIIDKGFLPFRPGTDDEVIDFIPGLAPFRVADIPMDFLVHDETHLTVILRVFDHIKDCAGLLINAVYDLEEMAVDAIRAEQIAVYPIGPLLPCIDGNSMGSNLLREDEECLNWLNGQADCSVLYVSFGSLANFSAHETQELALGLEACQQPFLWVIRPDAISGAVSDTLPDGFMSRTENRGLIISWAPQLAVLSHRSVGGFLFHCGVSSILESLWMGVPMIGYPKLSDHNTGLKLITDWGVGMALQNHGKVGIDKVSVEAVVRALMQGEEAKARRIRAAELKERVRMAATEEGHSKCSLKKFVQKLKQK